MEKCRAGQTLKGVHQLAVKILSQGLKDLGLLPNLSLDAIEHSKYRTFFPHSVGVPLPRRSLVACAVLKHGETNGGERKGAGNVADARAWVANTSLQCARVLLCNL